jgi:hypothetical protein
MPYHPKGLFRFDRSMQSEVQKLRVTILLFARNNVRGKPISRSLKIIDDISTFRPIIMVSGEIFFIRLSIFSYIKKRVLLPIGTNGLFRKNVSN